MKFGICLFLKKKLSRKLKFCLNLTRATEILHQDWCTFVAISSGILLRMRNVSHKFYVYGSVHRWSVLMIVQRDATRSCLFIILQVHCTCFGCQPHPSSGVHKTVTTASGTVQLPPSNVAKIAWPRWREVAAQKIWPLPEAVGTGLCIPDDGCGWHPKHVQWTCRIINRQLCVASRWAIINMFYIKL